MEELFTTQGAYGICSVLGFVFSGIALYRTERLKENQKKSFFYNTVIKDVEELIASKNNLHDSIKSSQEEQTENFLKIIDTRLAVIHKKIPRELKGFKKVFEKEKNKFEHCFDSYKNIPDYGKERKNNKCMEIYRIIGAIVTITLDEIDRKNFIP